MRSKRPLLEHLPQGRFSSSKKISTKGKYAESTDLYIFSRINIFLSPFMMIPSLHLLTIKGEYVSTTLRKHYYMQHFGFERIINFVVLFNAWTSRMLFDLMMDPWGDAACIPIYRLHLPLTYAECQEKFGINYAICSRISISSLLFCLRTGVLACGQYELLVAFIPFVCWQYQ